MTMPELEIILDLSRLLSRVLHPTPTGVDRVEMAYARELLSEVPDRLSFAAVHPFCGYGRLPTATVKHFLAAIEQRWESGTHEGVWASRRFALTWLIALRPRHVPRPSSRAGRAVYLLASPNNLTKPMLIASILHREQARFICLVHDLIPLEYPEYARPGGAGLHEQRIRTVTRNAEGIIANSHATLQSLKPWLTRAGRTPLTAVAHLGTPAADIPPRAAISSRPYFVCIGTIEPRKNHLLLLNIWRRLAEAGGPSGIPKLIIIGRRGWENEQVIDMLERCPLLVDCVEERGRLADRETRALLAGASALLLPSFAEGYGMPVTEALQLGIPVLCSDLPALREAGGDVPEFIDPLDGPRWMRMILDYSSANSDVRDRQCKQISGWQAPTWKQHIAIVRGLAERVAA